MNLYRATSDCNNMCPACEYDLSDMYIKDQLIKGVASDALQADLLAKAGVLKTLEQNASHAEAFESAVRDQMSMSGTPDIARMSTYRRRNVVYWPSTPPDMPFQRRGSAYSIGVGELGWRCGTGLKSHGTLIDWCTGREWPVNCMTVISAWWRKNMPFQRYWEGDWTII